MLWLRTRPGLGRCKTVRLCNLAEKRNPDLRLPRQAEHYSQIVGHFLAVKNSQEIAVAIQAHFQRLEKYHRQLLGIPTDDVEDDEPDE